MNFINIISLYSYHIFDNIKLPQGIDHETLVNTIMDKCALFTPLYTEETLLKAKIQNFFNKNYDTFNRIYSACMADYDPIENYNRLEEYTDEEASSGNSNSNSSLSGSLTSDSTNLISPYDANSFTNDSMSTNKQSRSDSSNTADSSNSNRNLKHSSHTHGNIGVTTSQQMLESELKIRPQLNIYDFISSAFFAEFVLFDL